MTQLMFTAICLLNARIEHDDEGATAVEYGLMVALIGAAIVLTVTALGGSLNDLFTQIKGTLDSV